jgi:nucleoside diphosphate kinase
VERIHVLINPDQIASQIAGQIAGQIDRENLELVAVEGSRKAGKSEVKLRVEKSRVSNNIRTGERRIRKQKSLAV